MQGNHRSWCKMVENGQQSPVIFSPVSISVLSGDITITTDMLGAPDRHEIQNHHCLYLNKSKQLPLVYYSQDLDKCGSHSWTLGTTCTIVAQVISLTMK